MKPRCTGLCHHNVKVASTGSAKMEADSWFGVASLHQHRSTKASAVKQPPAPTHWAHTARRGAGPSRDSSAWHLDGVVVVGSTEYPKSWLAAMNTSSTKNEEGWCGYATPLASVSGTNEEDRGVQQSPVWGNTSSSWLVTFNLHLHNQSAHCIDFDWRGFNCNLKIWPFQEFLK